MHSLTALRFLVSSVPETVITKSLRQFDGHLDGRSDDIKELLFRKCLNCFFGVVALFSPNTIDMQSGFSLVSLRANFRNSLIQDRVCCLMICFGILDLFSSTPRLTSGYFHHSQN